MNRKSKFVSAAAGVMIALGAVGGTSLVFAAPPLQKPPAKTQTARAYLGVNLSDSTGTLLVTSVAANGPAATAGLKVGDQVTAVNGTAVTTVKAAATVIKSTTVGSAVSFSIVRSGATSTVSVTSVAAPKPSFVGVRVKVTDGKVVVAAVEANSPAATAGVQVGDQIVLLNGTAITTARQFEEATRALATGSKATIVVTRNGANVTLTATVAERPVGTNDGGRRGKPADGTTRPADGNGPRGGQQGQAPATGTPPAGGTQGTPPAGGQGGQRGGPGGSF